MVLMSAFKIVLCSYVVKQHYRPCHLPVSFHTSLSVNQFHSREQLLHISLSFPSVLSVRSVFSLVSAASLARPTQTSQQHILMAWQVRLSLPGFDFFSSPCICPLIWKAAVKMFAVLFHSFLLPQAKQHQWPLWTSWRISSVYIDREKVD